MENTHILSIDRSSWHYKYYVAINDLWGHHISRWSDKTSICPYVQTMIWFTIAAILLSPLALMGFLYLTICRIFYNFVYPAGFLENFCECDLSNWHDYPGRTNSEYGNLALFGLFSTLLLIGIGFVSIILFAVFYNYLLIGYYTIHTFAVMYSIILRIGWVIFLFPAAIWGIGGWLYASIVYLWKTTPISSMLYWIGVVGIICFFVGLVVAGLQEVMYKLEKSSQLRKEKREQLYVVESSPRNPTWLDKMWNKVWGSIYYFFISKEEIIDGKVHKILSPMALFWGFLVAIKHQICPIVEFVDSKEEKNQSSQ